MQILVTVLIIAITELIIRKLPIKYDGDSHDLIKEGVRVTVVFVIGLVILLLVYHMCGWL